MFVEAKTRGHRLVRTITRIYVTIVISAALVAAVVLSLERIFWEANVTSLAYGLGHAHGREAFLRGERRLLVLSAGNGLVDTGERDGEFEIYTWGHYYQGPLAFFALKVPSNKEAEAYVDGYNHSMRLLAERGADCE